MKLIYVLLLAGLFNINAIAQSLNDYKYVLVPDKYDWAREVDEYQINSLTTFLFKKYGFDAYQLRAALPEDINEESCNSLTADVEEKSGLIRTRLKVILKDCNGDVVFISEEGTSKLKDFRAAHHAALRAAFVSIKSLKYVYNGKAQESKTPAVSQKGRVRETQERMTETAIKQEEMSVTKKEVVKLEGAQQTKEIVTPVLSQSTVTIDRYKSLDGAYSLEIGVGSMTFYEGTREIGSLAAKAAAFYEVETSEFSGRGYFSNDQFIVEREIKGVEGIIKMAFKKE